MLICILTKNVITSCSVTMMLSLHLESKPLMTLTTVFHCIPELGREGGHGDRARIPAATRVGSSPVVDAGLKGFDRGAAGVDAAASTGVAIECAAAEGHELGQGDGGISRDRDVDRGQA